jgi:hypothetical protein
MKLHHKCISFSSIGSFVEISLALHTNDKQVFFPSLALMKSFIVMDNLENQTMTR